MPHILRAALLLAVTVSLHARPIGSQAVDAAPFARTMARVASGPAGTIAVWLDGRAGRGVPAETIDQRYEMWFALLGPDGAPLGNQRIDGLEFPDTWVIAGVDAGADDRGFLIVAAYRGFIHTIRVTAEGMVTSRGRLPLVAYDPALAWNGDAYLLSVHGQVLLVDREGNALSGGIRPEGPPRDDPVACSDGGCLIAAMPVTAADFPPHGEIREIGRTRLDLPGAAPFLVPGPRGGYFAVTTSGATVYVLQLDATGTPSGPRWTHYLGIPEPSHPPHAVVTAAADGDSVIVQSWQTNPTRLVLVRFEPGGVVRDLPAGGGIGGSQAALVTTQHGVLVVVGTLNALFAAPAGSDSWHTLAISRRAQTVPVLIDGGDAILATWIETSGTESVWWTAIAGRDGTVRSEPVPIARDARVYMPRIMGAFGSSKFFVAYQLGNGGPIFGRFIGTDGALLGDAFELFEGQYLWVLTSVASDGTDFFAACDYGIQHVRADGTVVNRTPYRPSGGHQWAGTILAWDGSRFLSVYRDSDWAGCTGCPRIDVYVTTPLSRQMHLEGAVEEIERFESMIPVSPAVAAREGRALAVWTRGRDGSGAWAAAVFTAAGVLSRQELPFFARNGLQPHAVPTAEGFLVSAGPAVAQFDRDGRVTRLTTIERDALRSVAIPSGDGHALVFYVRIEEVPRLVLERVALPPLGPKRRAVRR